MQTLLRINALLWAGLLLAGAALSVPVLMAYERSSSLTWLDGKTTAAIEHELIDKHPWRQPVLNRWAALELRLFGEGRPGVFVGENGWLFTREEFPLASQAASHFPENLTRLVTTVRRLERDGLNVLVVPVPAKAEMMVGKVPAALRDRLVRQSVVLAALHENSVPVLDTRAMLVANDTAEPLFFPTETHWTPYGSRLVADAVAGLMQANGFVGTQPYGVTPMAARVLIGDLEHFVPVAPLHAALLPDPVFLPAWKTHPQGGSADEAALFGDAGRPVALVGTSYSADGRWMFANWLRIRLASDLDNFSEQAKGPFASMDRFLAARAKGESSASWVIWEIPVRAMFMDNTPDPSRVPAFGLGVF